MEDFYWNALLSLRHAVAHSTQPSLPFVLDEHGNVSSPASLQPPSAPVACFLPRHDASLPPQIPDTAAIFAPQSTVEWATLRQGRLGPEACRKLEQYLAYCYLPWQAHRQKRAVTVAHFAQSLDGKIATTAGRSKWIGNRENLVHAHRMRALCDAVLIGGGTLSCDQPKLTVRHVKGEHPCRVVIARPDSDFSSLLQACSKPVLVFGSEKSSRNGRIQYTCLPKGERGHIPSQLILEKLYERGIYSVYLEGGPLTTSRFLKDGAVDFMQLHLAPLVFGSGKSALCLPEIEHVREAVSFFEHTFHPVGDSIMFTGRPQYAPSAAHNA